MNRIGLIERSRLVVEVLCRDGLCGALRAVSLWMPLILAVGSVWLVPVFGQEQFGQITGLVSDASGAAIPGTHVDVINESTAVVRSTTTNIQGNYMVTSLIPGTYKIAASKAGFKAASRTGVNLDVSQVVRIDVVLEVGQISEQITVSAAGPLLQTETASVGAVIAESGVVDLPLNGRNYLQLATLVPGATAAALGSNSSGVPVSSIQLNGMRQSATSYAIDGADVSDQHFTGTAFTPAPDAIQEFKIDTNNMSAKYGGGGAIIDTVLKSGTNAFHGDAYEFFRNDAMNARNFFALGNPELRQNQFGGALGGPIRKNSTFFFVDYQGTRIRQGLTDNSIVPTAAQRAGNFAGGLQLKDPYTGQPLPGNQIPASAISPQTAFFIPFIPLPNTPGGTYVLSEASRNDTDQFDIRIDQQLRASDSLTFSYSFSQQGLFTPGAYPQNGALNVSDRPQFGVAGWTHTFGPATVNQARLSYTHVTGRETQQGLGTKYTQEAGIAGFEQTSQEFPGFPQLTISGFGGINGNALVPFRHQVHNWNGGDVLTIVRGKHTIDVGGDARWYQATHLNAQNGRGAFTFTGTYSGNAFADYLYGTPFTGTRNFPLDLFGTFQQNQDAFAQDTWKVSRRLTLIGGIRYDLIHPIVPLHNVFASVNPSLNQIVVASNSLGQINTTSQQVTPIILPLFQSLIVPSSKVGLPPSLMYTNTDDFAPRLGVAFDAGHGFVLRTGYGVFYTLQNGNLEAAGEILNPPFTASETPTNTTPVPTKTIGTLFPPLSPGSVTLAPVSFTNLDPNQPTPYVQQWNFSLQKVVSRVISVQASYVGSKGTHLNFALPVNIPNPGPGAIQPNRPNPFFASGNYINDTGTSSYNALQTVAEIRSWHGLYVIASYAWGKSLDNQSADASTSSVQDPNNVRAEWGISSFNIASRFTLASTYEIPFFRTRSGLVGNLLGAWSMSNIVTAQSGMPFTPTLSTDPANTGTPERPNRIASGGLPNPSINLWFNVPAFTVPAAHTYGNTARNILNGPGFADWDFSLFKDFKLSRHEGMKLQFRGELYNFTNTPAFGLPVSNIQAATAGKILSAGSARSVQLVLKVIF